MTGTGTTGTGTTGTTTGTGVTGTGTTGTGLEAGAAPVRGGVGTDIVSVARFTRLARTGGPAFLERWFTPVEIAYCTGKAEPGRHLAARFAAKEAVVKALPGPWDGPLPWRSVEVVNDARGAPSVRLTGAVREAADRAGVTEVQVSLSHCDTYATAVAVCRGAVNRDDLAGSGAEG